MKINCSLTLEMQFETTDANSGQVNGIKYSGFGQLILLVEMMSALSLMK